MIRVVPAEEAYMISMDEARKWRFPKGEAPLFQDGYTYVIHVQRGDLIDRKVYSKHRVHTKRLIIQ